MSFFDNSKFPARWYCGDWPAYLGWIHIICDIIIFLAYLMIPIIIFIYMRRKPQLYFSKLFILFSLFILFCGIGHLMDAIIFWHPIYPLAGLTKICTALVSTATVIGMFYYVPRALNLPGLAAINEQLLNEIQARTETENKLQELSDGIHHERARLIEAQRIGKIGDWSYHIEKDEIIWSEQVFTLFERDPLLGPPKNFKENLNYYTEESQKRLNQDVATAMGGKACEGDYEILLPSGTRVWHHGTIFPDCDPQSGDVIALRGTSQDITERKHHEGLFKTVVESSPAAMIICNQDGQITLSNQETTQLFGYSAEELLNKKVEMLIPDPAHDKHPQLRNDYFKDPQKRGMGSGRRLQGLRKDGTLFYVEIGLNPLLVSGTTYVLASIIDVTQSVTQEQQIQNYAKQLESINSELSQFASMASHDLKEPLRKMCFFSDLILKESQNLSDLQRESADRINNTALKMRHLVEGLLIFSKLGSEKIKRQSVSVEEKLTEIVRDIQLELNAHAATLSIDVQPKDLTFSLDSILFEHLLNNLIRNALKYNEHTRPLSIQITARYENNALLVTVTDNGIGFNQDQAELIFRPFVRLHDKQQSGSGLGLAICKKVCGLMNGNIRAESKADIGSSFIIELKDQ